MLGKLFCKHLICLFLVEGSVILKEYYVLCVDEIKSQVLGKDKSVKVLSAACRIVATCAVEHCVLYVLKLSADVEIKSEVSYNAVISFLYLFVYLVKVSVSSYRLIARIEHIGYLNIVLKSLSGSRRNNVSSCGVCLYNRRDLSEMFSISQGASAKFYNFNLHCLSPFFKVRPLRTFIFSIV